MATSALTVHDGLLAAARVPSFAGAGRRVSAVEVVTLLAAGVTAAFAMAYVRLGLRIPGNAILLAVFPMAWGLALAPRRLAGSLMSAGAFATASALTFGGTRFGSGAFVSLCLTGPLLDVALAGARRGWRLYLGFVLAGLGTNLLAFGSRAAMKLAGTDLPGMRPLAGWWSQALLTYAACGAIAGLVSAGFWFQFRDRERPATNASSTPAAGS